jgi:hypothetical protein
MTDKAKSPRRGKPEPDRLTPQQEAFAQAYDRLGNGSRAYRAAYNVGAKTTPQTIWNEASRLMQHPLVSRRIAELRAQAAEKAVKSMVEIVSDLDQSRSLAMDLERPSAAVSASSAQARILGYAGGKRPAPGEKTDAKTAVDEQVAPEQRSRFDFARRVALMLAKGKRAAGKVAAE